MFIETGIKIKYQVLDEFIKHKIAKLHEWIFVENENEYKYNTKN